MAQKTVKNQLWIAGCLTRPGFRLANPTPRISRDADKDGDGWKFGRMEVCEKTASSLDHFQKPRTRIANGIGLWMGLAKGPGEKVAVLPEIVVGDEALGPWFPRDNRRGDRVG